MNKTLYRDDLKNAIRVSSILKIESELAFTGLAVKYVVSGEETYFANNKKYIVKEGEYIMGNDFTRSLVQIHQKKPVQGLCIDLSTQVISEVAEYHDLNGSDLKEFLLSEQFLVNRYSDKNTSLGYTLKEINAKIRQGRFENKLLEKELFYCLAESIVTDQRFVLDHLRKMRFKKEDTNEDVFRALMDAKSFLDDQIGQNLALETLSSRVGISKYHFLRLFKNTFGLSPGQYQRRKRLECAKTDLIEGKDIGQTAFRLGYPDVSAFTKAFKNHFGETPGAVKKQCLTKGNTP